MRRSIATIALATVAVLVTAGAALANPVPWLAPWTLTAHAEVAGYTFTTTRQTFRTPLTGPADAGVVESYASVTAMRVDAARGWLPSGTTVLYDLESWAYTPSFQRSHPIRSLRRFVAAAHAAGLKAGIVPFHQLDVTASKVGADFFLAQTQGITDPVAYAAIAQTLAANMQPGETLLMELSTNRQTVPEMYANWDAARPYVGDDGFALWFADTPDQVANAGNFLSLVAATDAGTP